MNISGKRINWLGIILAIQSVAWPKEPKKPKEIPREIIVRVYLQNSRG